MLSHLLSPNVQNVPDVTNIPVLIKKIVIQILNKRIQNTVTNIYNNCDSL